MYSISAATLAYLRACKPCGVSIAVAGIGGNTTLTEDNLLLGSFEYDISGSAGNVIGLGAAPTGQVSFTIDNHEGTFSSFVFEGAVLTIQITTGGNDNIPLGKFIVDVQPKNLSTIDIVALDYMAKFYKSYDTDLTFPATLTAIAADACTKCGVVNALPTLPNGTYIASEKPADTTYHEIISAVAQLNGMFARIDRAGQLEMGWYVDEGADILISDRFELSSLAETDISITGIRVKTKDYEYLSGTSAYALVVENNILLANNEDDVEDFALSLLTAVGGFTYRPFRSIVKGLPHYEFGDILNPYTDPDSTSLVSIITDMRYLLRGTMTLEAVGEPEIRRGYATTAPFTAQQRAAVETAAETVANVVVSPYAQQLIYLNERAANSFGLFQTGVQQLDGSYIYYWHDSATLEGSNFISMFTETGYYWTNNGWNSGSPAWNFGFTSDGDAVFRYLSAVGLNADWINAGSINSGLITVGDQTLADALAGITSDISALSGGGTNYIQNSAWGTYDAPSLYWWNNTLTWLVLEKRIDTWTEFEANIDTWTEFEAYTW